MIFKPRCLLVAEVSTNAPELQIISQKSTDAMKYFVLLFFHKWIVCVHFKQTQQFQNLSAKSVVWLGVLIKKSSYVNVCLKECNLEPIVTKLPFCRLGLSNQ